MSMINIVVDFANPGAVSHTIRYARIDHIAPPVYTTVVGVTTSPFIIQGVPNGQYSIGITPVYPDGRKCPEIFQVTANGGRMISFSAVLGGSPTGNIVINYSANSPMVRVDIDYPNGGSFTQTYSNDGNPIQITPPPGVYGDYAVTMTPVVDSLTGFYGDTTAPIFVTIPIPSNSIIKNTSATVMTNVAITANLVRPQLIFSQISLAAHTFSSFYIADGFYSSIIMSADSFPSAPLNLITGSGSYAPVVTGNIATYNSVSVSGGIVLGV